MAPVTLHASCVAFGENAVLIRGVSGSGKSALALQLIALGGVLVADDQVHLSLQGNALTAHCPAAIKGKIEARGVGILNADTVDSATVSIVIDVDKAEVDRLPKARWVTILGCRLPLLHRADGIHFASAVALMMRTGRSDP